MRSTIVSIAIALGIVGLGFGVSNMLSSQKQPAPRLAAKAQVKQVTYQTVENQALPAEVRITGRLTARDRVSIFAEVTGTYLADGKPFKEGSSFSKDETLIHIDDREFRNSLKALKSGLLNQLTLMLPDLKTDYEESFPKWEKYVKEFDMDAPLADFPEPASDQERYFFSAKNIYNQYYNIRSQEARASKYRILAPFNGKVSESNITEGSLVRAAQPLGEFYNPYSYEMEAAVSLKDIPYVKTGSQVTLTSEDIPGTWKGRIIRSSDVVDEATQTVKVFVLVSGKGLREGMYLEGRIQGAVLGDVAKIARNLMVTDSTIFIVQDLREAPMDESAEEGEENKSPMVKKGKLHLHQVQPIQYTTNDVFVKGIPNGTTIISQPIINGYEGQEVILYEARN